MGTPIDEPITVGAVFNAGTVTPAWFVWQGRRYQVRAVTMRWQTAAGRTVILHLGVTDHANLFELTFNQETLAWRLAAVEAGGCE